MFHSKGTSSLHPPLASEITPIRTEPGAYAYNLWRNVSIGVWVGQATLPAVKRLFEMSREVAALHPGGRSSVVFVLDRLPAPEPDAQVELARMYDLDGLSCTVLVLEGSGFWAAGIRSMSTNAHLAGSRANALHITTSIEEVVSWLPEQHLRRTGVRLPPDELRRALMFSREDCAARGLAR